MTRQTLSNLTVLALLVLIALNTANIARSLRRIERMERHRRVGWYLMRPPMAPIFATGRGVVIQHDVNTAAPLWQWGVVETFPTQKECEDRRHAAFPGFYGPGGGSMPIPVPSEQCIWANDPRLKEK
jgi:hypothetical protein